MTPKQKARFEKTMRLIPGYDPWETAEKGQWFDPDLATLAIDFFPECLQHVEGAMAGHPFVLEKWQQAIVGNLFGWRQLDSAGRNVRRYREVLLYVPRKNGKTPLAAGIGLAVFTLDREEGQQDYIAAADRDQAGMLFRQCSGMVERSSELSGMYRVYGGHGGGSGQSRSLVKRDDPRSFLRVISADASSKHGGTSHLVLIDELHAQRNRELVDVMRTSMASANRIQPLLIYLTTADYEGISICNEVHDHARAVRDGKKKDSRFLPIVYEADEKDDWTDRKVWKAANPNLGISVSEEYLRREVDLAKFQPTKLNELLRLHLNVRTKTQTRWLSSDDWLACGEEFDREEFLGEPCIVGIDIATRRDMACVAALFEKEKHYYVIPRFWISRKQAEEDERRYSVPYRMWERQWAIILTDGAETNIDAVTNDYLATECTQYDVRETTFDPYKFAAMAEHLSIERGMLCTKISQNMANLAEPTDALEELIDSRRLHHGNHPVLSWCAHNAELLRDKNGNKRPVKPENAEYLKIDGIMALVIALARAIRQVQFVSQYETMEEVVV